MGHAKEIHKSIYRIPVPVAEITEVSKILLAAIGGDVNDDDPNDDDDNKNDEESDKDENSDSSDDENIGPVIEPVNDSVAVNESPDTSSSSSCNVAERTKSKTVKVRKIIRRRWTKKKGLYF
ncbi:protein dopey homolog PFC0245c-like [Microplitis mediator]|uniref:protein dopey homolog PFC0245c-like n=1 Tax=Microplitis mediator TaxID=375433 RepID=UPI00255375BA|nr:protein dopey homolog PFC0245c-like [Microplitis mediator]